MALKTYNPVTLNGNFNEDRAPPLGNGNVIADYGRHDARGGLPLSSTHAASFAAPPQPGASRPRQLEHKFSQGGQTKMLLKMTRLDSWHEAARPRDSKLTEPGNFTSLVPHLREGDTHKSSEWRSTTQHAFGVGHSPGERAELSASMRATDAPWVRGRPGLRQEKGKSTSGIMGEVLKDTPDEPQVDTAAQRCWMYGHDPALAVRKLGFTPEEPKMEFRGTLPGVGDASSEAYDPDLMRRRVASHMTRPPHDHRNVPAPGYRIFHDHD